MANFVVLACLTPGKTLSYTADITNQSPLKAHGRFAATGKNIILHMVDIIDHIPLKAHGRFAATGLEWNWQELPI